MLHRPARSAFRVTAIVLGCLGCAALPLAMVVLTDEQVQEAGTCHPMIMDFECVGFRQRYAAADSPRMRDSIVAEYRGLIRERIKLCPGSKKPGGVIDPLPVQAPARPITRT